MPVNVLSLRIGGESSISKPLLLKLQYLGSVKWGYIWLMGVQLVPCRAQPFIFIKYFTFIQFLSYALIVRLNDFSENYLVISYDLVAFPRCSLAFLFLAHWFTQLIDI